MSHMHGPDLVWNYLLEDEKGDVWSEKSHEMRLSSVTIRISRYLKPRFSTVPGPYLRFSTVLEP